jgi:hypothetical protein
MDAVGFRLCFTPLTGVLFTVPSRYCALSVTTSSSPWTVVGPASHRIARVRWYSRWLPRGSAAALRDYHPLRCGLPATSRRVGPRGAGEAAPAGGLTTPRTQRLLAWHVHGLGNGPFRSPLLRAWFYLLRLLRCFSSPGSRSATAVTECRSNRATGCPIRTRWDLSVVATPPPYRGCRASFIGWSCRGILRPRIMSCLVSGSLGSTWPATCMSGPARPRRAHRWPPWKIYHSLLIQHELVRCRHSLLVAD